jgi:hypothetical protein
MHLRKTSPWKRVVIEALTHRGFFPWTAVSWLMMSFINADGLIAEIRGGHQVRFAWKNGAACEYTLRKPTEIDSVLDEVLDNNHEPDSLDRMGVGDVRVEYREQ